VCLRFKWVLKRRIMQVDRKGEVCECTVVRYDRRSARHEVEWSGKEAQQARGRAWVDFAEDMVYREVE
jgi:hypothetical protein